MSEQWRMRLCQAARWLLILSFAAGAVYALIKDSSENGYVVLLTGIVQVYLLIRQPRLFCLWLCVQFAGSFVWVIILPAIDRELFPISLAVFPTHLIWGIPAFVVYLYLPRPNTELSTSTPCVPDPSTKLLIAQLLALSVLYQASSLAWICMLMFEMPQLSHTYHEAGLRLPEFIPLTVDSADSWEGDFAFWSTMHAAAGAALLLPKSGILKNPMQHQWKLRGIVLLFLFSLLVANLSWLSILWLARN